MRNKTPVEIKNYKTECIEGDCINGQGTYTFSNGNKYIGQFKDGKPNGRGTYTYGKFSKFVGDIYEGEFKNGMMSGHGLYTWPSGKRYDG